MQDKVSNFNNKVKIIVVIIILFILIAIISLIIINNKKKIYNVEEVQEYKYYQLNQSNKIGVIDIRGNIIIEPIYNTIRIPNPEKPVFICQKDEQIEVLNDKKEKIFTQYEEVIPISINGIVTNVPYEKTVLKYKKDGKYGILDFSGKQVTKPIYEDIQSLTNKESQLLVKKDGKYGVINSKGAKIIPCEYDDIKGDGFYTTKDKYKLSGYIVAKKTQEGYRYGYINHSAKKLLKTEYNKINRITETEETQDIYLISVKNGKVGVNKNDKILIDHNYQDIEYDEYEKLFKLNRNSQYGVANLLGKQVIPIEYTTIEFNGLYIKGIKVNAEEKYFDVKGNEIQDIKYNTLIKTENENYYISINNENLYGVIEKDNKVVINNEYTYIEYLFNDYFIATKEEGAVGIIDIKENIIVDFKYDVLQKIEGSNIIEAKLLQNDITELYSKQMEKIASMTHAIVSVNSEYLQIYSEQDTKYFDLDGNELSNLEIFKNNKLFSKKQNNKWGFVDINGNKVVDFKYDKVTEFNEYGFAAIKIDDKWGVINEAGNILQEPIYKVEDNIEPEFIGKYYKVYYGYGEVYFTDELK
ncbi:MAG: WG repeat-containing protein [Clostridia bacterium]|nr:WG repeat-containing protein [Clostridia bacterium]